MKTIRLLPLLVLFGVMLVSARAQLVHLAFRGFDGTLLFRADSGLIPWDHSIGQITRLDIYYDPAADLSKPLDPAKNVWRVLVTSERMGDHTITLPIEQIFVGETYLEFQRNSNSPFGILDATVAYTPTDFPNLPTPPITFGESNIYFSGGEEVFGIHRLAEAYGYGSYDRVKAEMVAGVGLSPVPEPSTYGLCAGALLTGLILKRRRTRTRN